MTRVLLSDPWFDPFFHRQVIANQGTQGDLAAGTIVTVANHAHYIPVIFPKSCTLYAVYFAAANGTGNYDLGLYDGETLALITSTGSTAMTAAGVKTLSLSDYRVKGGKLYYAALALSSTTGQVYRPAYGAAPTPAMIAAGWGMEASALPLPATATPVTTTAYTVCPFFGFGIR